MEISATFLFKIDYSVTSPKSKWELLTSSDLKNKFSY